MSEGFDLQKIMEQAQEMSGKLKRVQEELRHRTVDATVGGGMVDATVNGQLELVRIRIDPQAVDPRDVEMLQDLVVAAINQAMARAREMAQSEMQSATGLPLAQLMGQLGGGS
ncbi:MAG: YbaB/EbfC family nucleoid-associated protein [Myxococcota bacterium]